jgi:hypothetical protein
MVNIAEIRHELSSGRHATLTYNHPQTEPASSPVADLKMGWLFPPFETVDGAVPGIGRTMVPQLRSCMFSGPYPSFESC